jgi:hypothetical protein
MAIVVSPGRPSRATSDVESSKTPPLKKNHLPVRRLSQRHEQRKEQLHLGSTAHVNIQIRAFLAQYAQGFAERWYDAEQG